MSNGIEITPKKEERKGYLYTGTVKREIKNNVFKITLDQKTRGQLPDIKVLLKQGNEQVVRINGVPLDAETPIIKIDTMR